LNKKAMMLRFLILLIGLYSINLAQGQTCCSGGIPLSNNIGLEFSEDNKLILGVSYDFNNLNTLKNDSETLDDDSRLRTTHSVLVNAGYTITDRLSIEGLFSWVNQRRIINQFNSENIDETYGIGDAIALARYTILKNTTTNWTVNLGLGVKIPLGSSTEISDQGITLNADLQPGSNAWDMIYLVGASKTFDFRPTMAFSTRIVYRQTGENSDYFGDSTYRFGNEIQAYFRPTMAFSTRIVYRQTGENSDYFGDSTYRFGNEIQAYFSVSDQFLIKNTLINPGLSFKYRNAGNDQIQSIDLPNTGGDWVFIIPNFSIHIFQNIRFNAAAELPLYSRPDGIQLTPTYRLTTGFLFNLFNKPQAITIN
jgi:hypothetical protein